LARLTSPSGKRTARSANHFKLHLVRNDARFSRSAAHVHAEAPSLIQA